ncbi:MAG: response regulator transcription factor, partial [Actinomycetota bacterium]
MVSDAERIRLVIVDDQAMLRGALAALLELEDDLSVVGVAADGDEAVQVVARTAPDVCLMDIQMPGMDGIAATRAVRSANSDTRVLIVTTFARPGYLRSALDAGASGFVVKDAPAEQLADAVRRVHAGMRVVDHALAEASLFDGANPLG